MQKLVVKLNSLEYNKQTPMQAVSSLQGIAALEFNIKDSKITIIGENVDTVVIMKKLRKWHPRIETLGPAKEEKKAAPPPAADAAKNVKPLTEEEQKAIFLAHQAYYMNYHPQYAQPYYAHNNYADNPNDACVIC